MSIMRFWKILILPLCLLLLAGCQGQPAGNTVETTTQAPPAIYTVRFIYREQQVCQEQVPEGTVPQMIPVFQEEAYVLDAWLDEAGNAVDPKTTPVTQDITYTARVYPAFTKHVPYLFADEKGFVRPEDTITGVELTLALRALAVDPQAYGTLTMPEQESLVTKQVLQPLFSALFSPEKLEEAMRSVDEGDMTRAEFAQLMNVLTDRLATEAVSLEEGQQLPRDLALNRPDSADVLEAVLTHSEVDTGAGILDAVMAMPWKPGFTNLGGYLYYADENGQLLRDGTVGTMTFGADGCYTSGDPELDAMVAADLNRFILEYPDKERFDLLYETFLHCRDDFRYVGRGLLEAGQTGWEAQWAKQMFTSGAGNCYSYAAIFWAYARGLGYDAYCVSGWTTTERTPHGWVEIQLTEGAEPRIFDPELAMAYLRDGKDYASVWNMEMWLASQWPYYWP